MGFGGWLVHERGGVRLLEPRERESSCVRQVPRLVLEGALGEVQPQEVEGLRVPAVGDVEHSRQPVLSHDDGVRDLKMYGGGSVLLLVH